MSELRPLGSSGILVSPVALGCWPIAGMTSLDVNDADSLATLQVSLDAGVNFLDTAYNYGPQGESERLIARVIRGRREQVVLATKAGLHWKDGKAVRDARPETLVAHCEESLRRLETDRIDLWYIHAPDPQTPVGESALGAKRLLDAGKVRSVGVSNFSVAQLAEFAAVCPLTACQPHYNMLQREIEADVLPWCVARQVALVIYWPLMKGLLAGHLPRDHVFPPGDGRAKYPMFQGAEWQKNQDFLDQLRPIAAECGRTLSQVVINWTIHRPGVTAALCGAKRASQARENAGAMGWQLTAAQTARIDAAIAARGEIVSRAAV